MAQMNDLKSFEFVSKGNSSKAGACKNEVEENLADDKISIKKKPSRGILWFMNIFVCDQYVSKTKASGNILFLFTNSTTGEKHDSGYLYFTNTKVTIFSKTLGSIKFMN